MLVAKRSAGVAPEVNLREFILTSKPRAHVTRSPKQGSVAPQKGLMSSKFFFKKLYLPNALKSYEHLGWNIGLLWEIDEVWKRLLHSALCLFSVTGTIATEHSQISHVIALPGSKVAVSSTIQLITYNCHRLILYDLQTGRESSSMTLEENPSGMAQVTLADRACIAVSYRYGWFFRSWLDWNQSIIVLSRIPWPHWKQGPWPWPGHVRNRSGQRYSTATFNNHISTW